jgi:toxin CcdB
VARRYDVCRIVGLRAEGPVDLAVVLQDEALSDLATRVVAPLVPVGERFQVQRATPTVELDGVNYLIAVHLLTPVPRRNLGQVVANLDSLERQLKAAIDAVFFGV